MSAKRGDTIQAIDIPCVNRETKMHEVVAVCPKTVDIMTEYGLRCFSCTDCGVESLQDGCMLHGFDEEAIEALIDDLNDAIRSEPTREPHITITPAAARAIRAIALSEGRKGEGLAIIVDATGGFCMEFQKEPEGDDTIFTSEDEPDVRVFVSPLTLWRIGGATVDFREKRFKLDLPE